MSIKKSKVVLDLVNDVWTASTVFYNVPVIACAASVSGALRALKDDMHYIEYGLAMRLHREDEIHE